MRFVILIILIVALLPVQHTQSRIAFEKVSEPQFHSFLLPEIKTAPTVSTIGDILHSLGLDDLYALGYTGKGIRVAVIDSGINSKLDIFDGRVDDEISFVRKTNGYDVDEGAADLNGHGTMVASVLLGNNSLYQGAAPASTIVSVKVASGSGVITSAGLIAGIYHVIERGDVDIMSLSLSEPEEGALTDPLESAVEAAVAAGITVVCSAGNSGYSGTSLYTMGSPATSPQVIAVGSTDISGNMAAFSSNGPTMGNEIKPDIVAPGASVPAISITGNLINVQGTSFSTPLVSGSLAVLSEALLAKGQDITPGVLKSLMGNTANDYGIDVLQQGNGGLNISRSWTRYTSGETYLNALPSQIPSNFQNSLPQNAKMQTKVTLTSNNTGSWITDKIEGNITSIIRGIHFLDLQLPSDVAIIDIETYGVLVGDYTGKIKFRDAADSKVVVDFAINVKPKARGKILIDLIHSPWDSVLYAKKRLERKMGFDLLQFTSIAESNGYWVDEVVIGDLSEDLLSDYDILFIPSAFSRPEPHYFDHALSRTTELHPGELVAINRFLRSGGKLLIDFAGTSPLDSSFSEIQTETSSLKSLLTTIGLGLEEETVQQDTSVVFAELNLSSNIMNNPERITVKAGENWIEGGLPLMSREGHISSSLSYTSDTRVIVFNSRNWRDSSAQLGSFLDTILATLDGSDFLRSVNSQFNDESTQLILGFNQSITINNLKLEFRVNDQTIPYVITAHQDSQIIVELEAFSSTKIDISLQYDQFYANISKYLPQHLPTVRKTSSIDYSNLIDYLNRFGTYEIKLIIEDDAPIYPEMVEISVLGEIAPYMIIERKSNGETVEVSIKLLDSVLQFYSKDEVIGMMADLGFLFTIVQPDSDPFDFDIHYNMISTTNSVSSQEKSIFLYNIVWIIIPILLMKIKTRSFKK